MSEIESFARGYAEAAVASFLYGHTCDLRDDGTDPSYLTSRAHCPACGQCPACVEHPGWAHGDESRRNQPADICRACFGSGVRQDFSYTCAECGTTTAHTYVVTTLDPDDPDGTRTEICRECDEALRGLRCEICLTPTDEGEMCDSCYYEE